MVCVGVGNTKNTKNGPRSKRRKFCFYFSGCRVPPLNPHVSGTKRLAILLK